jgi:hypothetical protein
MSYQTFLGKRMVVSEFKKAGKLTFLDHTRRNQDASIARRAVVGGLGDNRNWLLVRAVARDH